VSQKIALDTNCLIDLEEDRPDAVHVKKLIQAWKDGRVALAVVAVSASENQSGGVTSSNFSVFQDRLNRIGLGDAHQLNPLGIWDVFFWDHFLWSSPEMKTLADSIRTILFPGNVAAPPENPGENSVWRNRLCDVLVAWSCIHHQWECLVTRDENFHQHEIALAHLGLKEILYPKEAVELYASGLDGTTSI
jgi:hypothetical protein